MPIPAKPSAVINDTDTRLPSPSISHAQFVVDMACMRCTAKRVHDEFEKMLETGNKPAFYLWSDSSPIGGMNWQNSSYDYIAGDQISAVADACRELVQIGRSDLGAASWANLDVERQ